MSSSLPLFSHSTERFSYPLLSPPIQRFGLPILPVYIFGSVLKRPMDSSFRPCRASSVESVDPLGSLMSTSSRAVSVNLLVVPRRVRMPSIAWIAFILLLLLPRIVSAYCFLTRAIPLSAEYFYLEGLAWCRASWNRCTWACLPPPLPSCWRHALLAFVPPCF